MKNTNLAMLVVLATVAMPLEAQTELAEPTEGKTLAATMNVYVFPAEGQVAEQQNKDEAECYTWAVKNTGTDPFELAKQAELQQQQTQQAKEEVSQAGKGSAAKGALAGAAAGALIGEIASDDPGTGAAIGAGVGALGGRRARRQRQAQANEQIDQQSAQAQQANKTQVDNFKKAFSVCLEAKDYMVKF
jgi:hypothetical protein